MINILEDISKVSTIPLNALNDVVNISELCISHSILESKLNNEDMCNLDIGIGKLNIQISDTEIKYKFTPSLKLEKTIVETLQNKESKLTKAVEDKLTQRILTAYKDLL